MTELTDIQPISRQKNTNMSKRLQYMRIVKQDPQDFEG